MADDILRMLFKTRRYYGVLFKSGAVKTIKFAEAGEEPTERAQAVYMSHVNHPNRADMSPIFHASTHVEAHKKVREHFNIEHPDAGAPLDDIKPRHR